MSCEAFGLLISKWVDGEAKPDEARRVEAHVSACAACRRLADEFRRNEALVEAAFGPESFGQRVAGGVAATIARRESFMRWGARLAVAAGVISAILWMREDRKADERARTALIQAYMEKLAALEAAIAAQPETKYVILKEPVLVPYIKGTDRTPEQEAVVRHQPDPPVREEEHATFAKDNLVGRTDFNTGAVHLAWTMLRSPGAQYHVYRREGAAPWGAPINAEPLLMARYDDTTARALATYEYLIVAVSGGIAQASDVTASVTTPPDLMIHFKGRGEVDGKEGGVFHVEVRRNGAWHVESFTVLPGRAIGEVKKGIDYSTGFRLEICEVAEQLMKITGVPREHWPKPNRPRAVFLTPSGKVSLWNEESVIGSRERVERVQVEDAR